MIKKIILFTFILFATINISSTKGWSAELTQPIDSSFDVNWITRKSWSEFSSLTDNEPCFWYPNLKRGKGGCVCHGNGTNDHRYMIFVAPRNIDEWGEKDDELWNVTEEESMKNIKFKGYENFIDDKGRPFGWIPHLKPNGGRVTLDDLKKGSRPGVNFKTCLYVEDFSDDECDEDKGGWDGYCEINAENNNTEPANDNHIRKYIFTFECDDGAGAGACELKSWNNQKGNNTFWKEYELNEVDDFYDDDLALINGMGGVNKDDPCREGLRWGPDPLAVRKSLRNLYPDIDFLDERLETATERSEVISADKIDLAISKVPVTEYHCVNEQNVDGFARAASNDTSNDAYNTVFFDISGVRIKNADGGSTLDCPIERITKTGCSWCGQNMTVPDQGPCSYDRSLIEPRAVGQALKNVSEDQCTGCWLPDSGGKKGCYKCEGVCIASFTVNTNDNYPHFDGSGCSCDNLSSNLEGKIEEFKIYSEGKEKIACCPSNDNTMTVPLLYENGTYYTYVNKVKGHKLDDTMMQNYFNDAQGAAETDGSTPYEVEGCFCNWGMTWDDDSLTCVANSTAGVSSGNSDPKLVTCTNPWEKFNPETNTCETPKYYDKDGNVFVFSSDEKMPEADLSFSAGVSTGYILSGQYVLTRFQKNDSDDEDEICPSHMKLSADKNYCICSNWKSETSANIAMLIDANGDNCYAPDGTSLTEEEDENGDDIVRVNQSLIDDGACLYTDKEDGYCLDYAMFPHHYNVSASSLPTKDAPGINCCTYLQKNNISDCRTLYLKTKRDPSGVYNNCYYKKQIFERNDTCFVDKDGNLNNNCQSINDGSRTVCETASSQEVPCSKYMGSRISDYDLEAYKTELCERGNATGNTLPDGTELTCSEEE